MSSEPGNTHPRRPHAWKRSEEPPFDPGPGLMLKLWRRGVSGAAIRPLVQDTQRLAAIWSTLARIVSIPRTVAAPGSSWLDMFEDSCYNSITL